MWKLKIARFAALLALICLTIANIVPAKATAKTVHLAMGSPPSAMTIQGTYGPLNFGSQFGLSVSKDDVTIFDSGTLSTQAVLAGEADVTFVSFTSMLLLRQAGQNFKTFCPITAQIDHVMVGRNGVTKIEQLRDPKVRVAISAPGASASTLIDALLMVHKVGISVKDLTNTKVVENVNTRQTAWVANEVDVSTMRLSQFRQAQKQVPDGVIIAKMYEDLPTYIFAAFIAPTSWLNQNRDAAAALCASILKGNVELTRTFDAYKTGIKTVIEKPPTDDVLKESYDLITQYGFWAPSKTMNTEAASFMSKIAVVSGVLKQESKPEDSLDMETYNAALQLLSADDRKALAQMAVVSPNATAAATMSATQKP